MLPVKRNIDGESKRQLHETTSFEKLASSELRKLCRLQGLPVDLLALNIIELRDMCKRKGVSTAGAKELLVARLCEPAASDDTIVERPSCNMWTCKCIDKHTRKVCGKTYPTKYSLTRHHNGR